MRALKVALWFRFGFFMGSPCWFVLYKERSAANLTYPLAPLAATPSLKRERPPKDALNTVLAFSCTFGSDNEEDDEIYNPMFSCIDVV